MKHVKTSTQEYYLDNNGGLHGEYNSWRHKGNKMECSNYIHGELHGEYKFWYDNGVLLKHCHYDNGEMHGECMLFGRGGKIVDNRLYCEGEPIHDLLENPLSGEEKFELSVIHGGKWLER